MSSLSDIPLIGNLFLLPTLRRPGPAILFYDSECGLCSSTVEFLIRIGKVKNMVFAPLFGTTYQELIGDTDIKALDSIVLFDQQRSAQFYRSRAVFIALSHCSWSIRWLVIFALIPRELGDFFYRLIASVRKQIFGSRCMVLSESEKRLFKQ